MSATTLADAIRAAGYAPPTEIIWDGTLRRFASDAKKAYSKDAWYVAFDGSRGRAAAFGSWRDSRKEIWSNGTGRTLTPEDWAEIDRQKKAEEAAMAQTRQHAAQRAAAVYTQAATAGASAYLTRKGIQLPAGVRFVRELPAQPLGFGREFGITGLVVPVMNAQGAFQSVQFIPESGGKKYFLPGGKMGGGFFVLGDLPADAPRLALVEGLATGQSVVEATGWPVVVAFSAGNLPGVAEILRSRHPQADIILCGDDDPAGRAKATEAATLVKGRAVFPPDAINDFNDLHQARGLESVKAVLQPSADETDVLWRTELMSRTKEDGSQILLGRLHNLILILEHAPEWAGRLALNELMQAITCDGREWSDSQAFELKAWLEKNWIPSEVKTSLLHESVEAVAARHPYHPVRDHLLRQRWDGIERLPTFFTDFCGTPFSPYSEAVSRSLFVSAVARIMEPGCKVDTMIVLEGAQGAGKSQLVLALFTSAWHMEITEAPGSLDFSQNLRGRWCAEFGELAAFGKADKSRLKQTLSVLQDTYRASYARNARTHPRQCIFIGTTNQDNWNDDPTGARRFFPIRCTDINIDAVKDVRDQLWAEAVHRYQAGETWWNIPDAEQEQDARYDQDVWEEKIADWLKLRQRATVLEVMEDCLGLKVDRQGKTESTRVGIILRRLKWSRKQESSGDRRRFYIPPKPKKTTT